MKIYILLTLIFIFFGCTINSRSTNNPEDLMEAEKIISKFYYLIGEKKYADASKLFTKNSYFDSLKLKQFSGKILKECGKETSIITIKNNSVSVNEETQGLLENNVYREKQHTEEFFDLEKENGKILIKDYRSRVYKSLE